MQHAEVVLDLLLPTDQNPAESIHPAVGPLYHPATGLEPRLPLQRLRLLASGPYMRREAELPNQLPGVVVVVTLVQTHPLRLLLRRLGTLHRDALQRRLHQLLVVAVWPPPGPPPPPPPGPPPQAPPWPPPCPLRRVLSRPPPAPRG